MTQGIIKTFKLENGFGTLVLETGEEVPFDISASNKLGLKIGEVAEVTIGVGYNGKPKAKRVIFELEADRAPSFATGFKQLRALGFFAEWDLKDAKAAADEVLEEVPPKLLRAAAGGLFDHYYGDGLSARGRAEGVIMLDWRFGQVTQTPAEDLLALCPADTQIELRPDGHRVWVSGAAVDLADGLGPLLKALNGALETAASEHRFFSLDFESDAYVIVCRHRDFVARAGESSVLKLD